MLELAGLCCGHENDDQSQSQRTLGYAGAKESFLRALAIDWARLGPQAKVGSQNLGLCAISHDAAYSHESATGRELIATFITTFCFEGARR